MNTQKLPDDNLAVHWAAELDPGNDAPTIGDQLAEAGLTDTQVAAVESLVEREAERLGYHRASEVLREIFARVSCVSTSGAALAFALGLAENKSLTELGAQFGASKQAVNNLVRRLSAPLNGLAVSSAGKRPDMPGDWLTLAEAAKACGRNGGEIQSAAQAGTLRREFVGHRGFYERAELRDWADQLTLDRAICTQPKSRPLPNPNSPPSENSSA